MRVSADVTDVIVEAVLSNCIKRDGQQGGAIKVAVKNVIHYINKLNAELKPDQTVYEGMSLENIMLPSGLASLLWPRRVQFDINNRLQSNLIYQDTYDDNDTKFYQYKKTGSNTGIEVEVAEYSYADFLRDLTLIKVAMKSSELQLNTSVLQATKDVDLLSIVDRLEVNGNVKWSGSLGSEFIPIRLIEAFNLGLPEDEYFVETKTMLKSLFNSRAKDFFTK